MNQELVTIPQADTALKAADDAYAIALAYDIDSPEIFEAAGDELRAIATKRKEIEETRMTLTRPLDESKRRIMDLFRVPIDRLTDAETKLRKGMLTYQQSEREKAYKARREAEAVAAREREQLERAARESAEAARKAQEAAAVAEAAGDKAAAEVALEAAQEATARAEDASIEAEIAAVAPAYLPTVAPTKIKGIGTRETWKHEVTDLRALILAAAKRAESGDDFLLGYLCADDAALASAARSMKSKLAIPGVRAYSDESLSVRKAG
jgi:membrane protein involved in colicin uptake